VVRKGSEYAVQAANSSTDKGPMAIGFVVQAGKGIELAGDLSTDKCTYYRRAVDVLENRGPPLHGETTTVNGKIISLVPVLDQKRKTITEIQKKLAGAHCLK
jgi:hypothetical protein